MSDSTILPGVRAALVARDGTTSPEFYRFFRSLSVTADLPARVDDLTVRVRVLEDAGHNEPTIGNVQGQQSIVSEGILSNGLVIVYLEGDVDIAPALSFYGALNEGAKGWQTFSGNFEALDNGDDTQSLDLADLADSGTGTLQAITVDTKGRVTGTRPATITGTAGNITVAHGDASDGLPTIDLAEVTVTAGGTLQRLAFDAKGRLSQQDDATTTDLTEGSNLYYTDARADARIEVAKADPDGIASLVSGKLDPGQLPALAITETFVVNTEAEMLALDCQQGDVAVRTDLSQSFILTAEPASTLANWQELLVPTGGVTSFNGRTGPVTPASGDYTFSQIASTPTTLAGYGITDAVPSSRTVNGKVLSANVTLAAADVGAEPSITAGTTAQYRRGDKTWQTLNKAAVGLGNVDNTSDADKPVSTAQASAIALKLTPAAIGVDTTGAVLQVTNLDTITGACFFGYTGSSTGAPPQAGDGTGIQLQGSGQRVQIVCTEINSGLQWRIDDAGAGAFSTWMPLTQADSGWIAPSLAGGWTNYGGSYSVAGYRRVGNRVFLQGLVAGGSTGTSTVFTLPAGYRPTGTLMFPLADNSSTADKCAVSAAGVVEFRSLTSTTYVSLSGISFFVD